MSAWHVVGGQSVRAKCIISTTQWLLFLSQPTLLVAENSQSCTPFPQSGIWQVSLIGTVGHKIVYIRLISVFLNKQTKGLINYVCMMDAIFSITSFLLISFLCKSSVVHKGKVRFCMCNCFPPNTHEYISVPPPPMSFRSQHSDFMGSVDLHCTHVLQTSLQIKNNKLKTEMTASVQKSKSKHRRD